MSWILVAQLMLLMLTLCVLIITIYGSMVDKAREDDIKRKEEGLL